GLAMAAKPAIVLAAAEVLDVDLSRRVLNHLRKDPDAFQQGLPNPRLIGSLAEQHAVELHTRARLGVPVIDLHHIAFTDSILVRTVFKDCVHRLSPPADSASNYVLFFIVIRRRIGQGYRSVGGPPAHNFSQAGRLRYGWGSTRI